LRVCRSVSHTTSTRQSHAAGGQYMRRIGPLAAAFFEPALGLGMSEHDIEHNIEHNIEQALLRASLEQAGTERAQDRVVEAGVAHTQAQGVFPVQATPPGVGRLPVGQAFHKLQHTHQG
jgi:hypothetical protein